MTPPKPLTEFIAEAGEIVDALGRELLALDAERSGTPDPDRINAIFRSAHSLKGLAGIFGQDAIGKLAHAAEDLLDRLRLGKVPLSGEVVDALIASLDVFQRLLVEAAEGESHEASASAVAQMAQRLVGIAAPVKKAKADPLERLGLDASVRNVLTEYEEHRIRENLRKKTPFYKLPVSFPITDFDTRLSALTARIKSFGELLSTLPSPDAVSADAIGFELLLASGAGQEALEALAREAGGTLLPLASKRAPKRARPAKAEAGGAEVPEAMEAVASTPEEPENVAELPPREPLRPDLLRSLTQTVRVDIRKLDALMHSVGELIRIRANLQSLAEAARQGEAGAAAKMWGQELSREGRQLERKLEELQTGLLEARMVPLTQLFEKLSRLVRRIARESGKEISFVTRGGEVELDKLIIEELSDPLMHLIRNAIDHGVERPDARAKKGKARQGEIALDATQKGAHVEITVRDDGAGVDLSRVREIGKTRGLLSAAQAGEASERELLNLLFTPGFSTASAVSELSGRGVGLDVVKNNIGNLSGIIDVASERGAGTTFTLTLPVTLAIIRALIVGVSDRVYALPLNSVLEILSVAPSELRTIERREVVSLRGQTLPLVRLARLFGLPERPVARHFVVVVGLAQERIGIALDELHGQQDIVTKPLGGRLKDVRGIAGATELGNRRTVLVLDVGELMEEVLRASSPRRIA